MHPEQAAGHLLTRRKQFVDPCGLSGEVGIVGAQDDPGVPRVFVVKAAKVQPVQGHDGPPRLGGIAENQRIRITPVALSVFYDGQDIVPQFAKTPYNRQGDVLISVEQGHGLLCCVVLLHHAVDFATVAFVIGPGVPQVFGPQ